MNDATTPATIKRASLLESAVLKLFTRNAQVLDIEDIGSAFRIITLGGDALRNVAWTPGDKIQIQLGGWVQRTYTPMDWDAENGRTRILIYLHAGGPGVQWVRTLRKGDTCIVFGPRKSIDLTELAFSAVLFGDETSFGLAAVLLGTVQPANTQLFLEVSSLTESQPAIARFGLENAQLGVRTGNDAQLTELEEKMLTVLQAQPAANIVLSGNASSIQHMRKLLKRLGIASNRFQAKAYWAPGKTGLD
ncbi:MULTISPECIES: siderophore-interacting protein [unclassified Pseudomonas]|uniref:siderophore-interacting protein n=1 Tax=unclassified Pseudomonas TaxID=196821 RepID=UPI000C88C9A0|nr:MULTISPECIES: siderophore-interacting protein [unclassified Pseudomonas]PMX27494.1 siderophore-interacting protein [Pseudomonas sp. GW460-12]PMX29186.1 siderophore-interacting protein [Pseudomonas sp. MPR-R2A4]PMX41845.1 siderophore-interacting protein [Pseudomonas sp. MPR-R2A7]PMX46782.1 siderophore-interacting protein [Pseudomonas sp. MPR-R2A6]PMX91282.1 siderophore-interacting protein [Pseudomonas sp. MPR-R2A3]